MTCHCLHSVVLWNKEYFVVVFVKTKQNNKMQKQKTSFCFFFVSPWGNDLSLSAFCCFLFQRTKANKRMVLGRVDINKNKKQPPLATCCDNMSWGNDLLLSAFCYSLYFVLWNKE